MILAEFTSEVNNIQVENLYQWDTHQTLKISGIDFGSTAPQVHFCNKKSETALAVQGMLNSDGSCIASIPNSLLTEPYDIAAYIYLKTAASGNTIKCIVIPLIARQKPSDYVLTTDKDIAEITAIELEAKAIIDNLTASAYSATESYKRPNIVYYDNGAYMCKSSVAVTGVAPTDSTVWQLLCKGTNITSVSIDGTTGNLVFMLDNGGKVYVDTVSAGVAVADPYIKYSRLIIPVSVNSSGNATVDSAFTFPTDKNDFYDNVTQCVKVFAKLSVGDNTEHLPLVKLSSFVSFNSHVETQTVSAKTGTIGESVVEGGARYKATGSINIGTNRDDVNINNITSTLAAADYDPSTGLVTYTLYGNSANATVKATITYTVIDGYIHHDVYTFSDGQHNVVIDAHKPVSGGDSTYNVSYGEMPSRKLLIDRSSDPLAVDAAETAAVTINGYTFQNKVFEAEISYQSNSLSSEQAMVYTKFKIIGSPVGANTQYTEICDVGGCTLCVKYKANDTLIFKSDCVKGFKVYRIWEIKE